MAVSGRVSPAVAALIQKEEQKQQPEQANGVKEEEDLPMIPVDLDEDDVKAMEF